MFLGFQASPSAPLTDGNSDLFSAQTISDRLFNIYQSRYIIGLGLITIPPLARWMGGWHSKPLSPIPKIPKNTAINKNIHPKWIALFDLGVLCLLSASLEGYFGYKLYCYFYPPKTLQSTDSALKAREIKAVDRGPSPR